MCEHDDEIREIKDEIRDLGKALDQLRSLFLATLIGKEATARGEIWVTSLNRFIDEVPGVIESIEPVDGKVYLVNEMLGSFRANVSEIKEIR